MTDIIEEIASLKKQHDAAILAHYYQDGEIQELADYTGDSLKLARTATQVQSGTIVFCGVHFMAETAKILNPAKRVLLPDLQAGCSLAESCPAHRLFRFQEMLRANERKFQTVAYINTSAAVKALSDWIVTSSNAEEVTGRKMILWNGACMVHEIFSVADLLALKRRLPQAVTIAHPECPANIREHSDYIGGTEGMIRFVAGFGAPAAFLVATEANMLWQLQSQHPRHRYHPVPGITCACNKCPHMARNTLEKLRDCLETGSPEIAWQPEFERARAVVERSLLN